MGSLNEKVTDKLRNCHDCGQRVSPQADACPNCGRPDPAVAEEKRRNETGTNRWMGVAGLGVVVLLQLLQAGELSHLLVAAAGCFALGIPVATFLAIAYWDTQKETWVSNLLTIVGLMTLVVGVTLCAFHLSTLVGAFFCASGFGAAVLFFIHVSLVKPRS